ncbi:hypothetical protein [Limnohabitans sp. DM1]|uniref:hypothetical protein n=1 Tax=Limnohabitans sp. DM1 TaxID=1597955 RepID=UPI000A67FE09|nr:hypothetical protein [Limnohabitans sp. DM1]
MKYISALVMAMFTTLSHAGVAQEMAEALKAKLPKRIDSMTTAISADSHNNEVFYVYKIDSPHSSRANYPKVISGLKELMASELCDGKMSGLFPSGLKGLNSLYLTLDNKVMGSYRITELDCKPPQAPETLIQRFNREIGKNQNDLSK